MGSELRSRREFLQQAAGVAALSTVPAWANSEAEPLLQKFGPNDSIQIGVIGPGGPNGGYQQGLGVTRHLASKAGVKVIAACDVDRGHLNNAVKVFGSGCKPYDDFRELLANPEIDAVVIGTPDHWHAIQAVAAMKAGKDVYCEKPLTLTVAEGRQIANTARQTKRVFQVGSQQRSDGRFRLACELVRNGVIGKLTTVTTHLPTGPEGGPFGRKPIPRDLNFNAWLGPAAEADYCPERVHGSFRWWLDYSGGMLTDWGAHHNDIAQWALGTDDAGPLSVRATGKAANPVGADCYNTYPAFRVTYQYPGDVTMICTNEGENGVKFEGTEGWIFVSRGRIEASNPAMLKADLSKGTRLYASNDHGQNFLDCMRSRKPTICTAEIGHRSATVCHLANISLRLGGRPLLWDARKERFTNSEEANLLLARPNRKWD